MRISFNYWALFILLSMIACRTETENVDAEAIENDWTIVGAERDGKAASTLNGMYLNFNKGILKTNYLMRHMEKPYAFNKEDNTVDIGTEKGVFYVHYLSADSMHLTTEIRKTKFDFYLK